MLDAVFVGGGVIGLACAWRAQAAGLDVCVLERDRVGSGASRVAAGVLAPDTDLGRRSLELYPRFVEELGADVGFWRCGMLTVTVDAPGGPLAPSECRALEPGLSDAVRGGMLNEQDASVDPRRLVDELAARVAVREGIEVASVARTSVTTRAGETIEAGRVVVCAGAWSGVVDVPVRPVKGQAVRLRGALPSQRIVHSEHVYVVPRQNGEVVVGATVEERGFDTTVTAGAVQELLREACRILPAVAELEVAGVSAGLRPGSPDGEPLLGELASGVLVATGHFRNGILLAPVTAETIAAVLIGKEPPAESLPLAPERFAPV
jgi:glycine oxidase